MDKREAREILDARLSELRRLPYAELVQLMDRDDSSPEQRTGSSGKTYQLDTQVIFDDKPGGVLRVMVAIDDGGWRAFLPMTGDFLIAPDGSFVGE